MASEMTESSPLRVCISDAPPYWCFSRIASGKKRYEGRLTSKIIEWQLEVGKKILFYSRGKKVLCVVTEILLFQDFGEAYDALGDALMPGMTRRKVVEMYNSFWIQPREQCDEQLPCLAVRLDGVVCIGIRIVLE